MQRTIFFMPALAVLCLGVAIPQPQVIVTGTPIGSLPPQETFTFVIPCYPGEADCSPRTVIISPEGEVAAASNFKREPDPQVIVSASRTVIIGPPPPPPTSISFPIVVTVTKTATMTETKTTTEIKTKTETAALTTTVTTTVQPVCSSSITTSSSSIIAALPPTTSKPSPTSKSKSISEVTGSRTVSIGNDKRQILGTPTRTVPLWPSPDPTTTHSYPFHPVSTVTVTITITESSSSYSKPGNTFTRIPTYALNERQVIGTLTRTVPLWPQPYPTTTLQSYTLTTATETVTIYTGTVIPGTDCLAPTTTEKATSKKGGHSHSLPAETMFNIPSSESQEWGGQPTRSVVFYE
jgi:hypothetical protein